MRLCLLLLVATACAAPRAERGHFDLRAVHPQHLFEQVHVSLKVEDGRVAATWPVEGAPAEIWLDDNGCARIMYRSQQLPFCPVPDQGPTAYAGPLGEFETMFLDNGRLLRIVLDHKFVAHVILGKSPASEEFRRHPELLGAVARTGGLPPSDDGVFIGEIDER